MALIHIIDVKRPTFCETFSARFNPSAEIRLSGDAPCERVMQIKLSVLQRPVNSVLSPTPGPLQGNCAVLHFDEIFCPVATQIMLPPAEIVSDSFC